MANADFDFAVPIVSAIIERERDGEIEVLIQTRWKPGIDPKYSGTLEIPAGGIGKHENVYAALKREVYEETGLRVIDIKPNVQTETYSRWGDEVFAFVPFCCQQQTKGTARVGFVFLCTVEDREPNPNRDEVRDIQWVNRRELRTLLEETPERIFTFQLGVLHFYLDRQEP
jgi:8-oxo-dGTP pyrophosphatase MutT (NUDIX family)